MKYQSGTSYGGQSETSGSNKTRKKIPAPMRLVQNYGKQNKEEIQLYHNAPRFVPAGQSTQMIIGATKDGLSDSESFLRHCIRISA